MTHEQFRSSETDRLYIPRTKFHRSLARLPFAIDFDTRLYAQRLASEGFGRKASRLTVNWKYSIDGLTYGHYIPITKRITIALGTIYEQYTNTIDDPTRLIDAVQTEALITLFHETCHAEDFAQSSFLERRLVPRDLWEVNGEIGAEALAHMHARLESSKGIIRLVSKS